MATITCFEELQSWQEARKWTKWIYLALQQCKDFGFRDQIQRASVSVMNNLAEWFVRFSTKDTIQFVNIALSSLAEVKSMLYLAGDLHYMTEKEQRFHLNQNAMIEKFILWWLKYLHSYKNQNKLIPTK